MFINPFACFCSLVTSGKSVACSLRETGIGEESYKGLVLYLISEGFGGIVQKVMPLVMSDREFSDDEFSKALLYAARHINDLVLVVVSSRENLDHLGCVRRIIPNVVFAVSAGQIITTLEIHTNIIHRNKTDNVYEPLPTYSSEEDWSEEDWSEEDWDEEDWSEEDWDNECSSMPVYER